VVKKIKENPVPTLIIGSVVFLVGQLIAYTNGLEKLAFALFLLMCACVFIMIAISWRRSSSKEEEGGEE